jgi:GNAT superfamily N-acetyltransferase
MQIEPGTFDDVRPYLSTALREGLSMANPPGCQWFLAIEDGKMVGFAALVITGTAARLKSDYVMPRYRGRGAGAALVAARLEEARRQGAVSATAFCADMSIRIYQRHGFIGTSRNRSGAVYVKAAL